MRRTRSCAVRRTTVSYHSSLEESIVGRITPTTIGRGAADSTRDRASRRRGGGYCLLTHEVPHKLNARRRLRWLLSEFMFRHQSSNVRDERRRHYNVAGESPRLEFLASAP
jgi:hypothetical protein